MSKPQPKAKQGRCVVVTSTAAGRAQRKAQVAQLRYQRRDSSRRGHRL
eukprot:CAMPEP_0119385762 /NCGR_PEP_ID=MMETSP1334-20130426/92695_1 /TAXON_ID=127549 /ORGANISM="Calcidiscus leptoporus, Strain RCC1130" /LENGTH=47 /DNA_ID= /DNA_START= /DNA_END= /DNA_ORIENTATION=